MKNKLSLFVFSVAVSFPLWGEGTASPLTRVLFGPPEPAAAQPLAADEDVRPLFIPTVIRLDRADAAVPDFVYEYSRRGDLVLVSVPADRLEEVLSAPGVLRMEAGICATPVMDVARGFCSLPQVYATEGPSGTFSGKGVVVGFSDIGFDPGHINFTDEAGVSRVRRMAVYSPYQKAPERYLSATEIMDAGTDDADNWHATHVAGIMAGGYTANGLQGVAPGADIVATTSMLHEGHLLAGMEEVVGYARSVDAPVPVVNMSVSSSIGPHDGSTLFNRYMERLAQDAVICVSAGNDGDKWGGYFPYAYADDKPRVQAFCREDPTYSPHHVAGIVDLWSLDERPLTLRVLVYDSETKRVIHSFPTVDIAVGVTSMQLLTPDYDSGAADEVFSQLFATGYVTVSCEVNPENGRYNATMAFDCTNPGDLHNHWIGVEVEGAPGTAGEVYASSGIKFMMLNNEVSASYSNARSINDLACGHGPAVVGSLTSRFGDGGVHGLTVSSFSSFSTLLDGRVLPSFCAPGGGVISSVSAPWVEASGEDTSGLITAQVDGTQYYWKESSGTSMSSPYAAGVFALWLEADPTLTPAEIVDIATRTATAPPDTNRRWGGGVLDAYAGLQEVMRRGALCPVTAETPVEIGCDGAGLLSVRSYTVPLERVEVYDLTGRVMCSATPAVTEWCMDLTGYPAGIYMVKASAGAATRVAKVALR